MTLARLSTSDGARLLHHLRYTYDAMGNVLTLQDYWNNNGSPQTQSFTYDALYRLASAQAIGGLFGNFTLESYSYNATSGNLESKAGVSYTYDANHPHAVASLSNGNTYQYDLNGNQVTRNIGSDSFTLLYDAENRLVEVQKNGLTIATFTYDGDGKRVKSVIGGETILFVGNHYEIVNGSPTKYYFAGAQRLAVRKNGALTYLLGDHLGSTTIVVDASGNKISELKYRAWGEVRYSSGAQVTDYTYTGQFSNMDDFGLMYYGARWYDPSIMRWTSPDPIVPLATQGVQAFDRYAYVNNSPVNFTDPSGHMMDSDSDENGCSGAGLNCIMDMYSRYDDYEGMDDSIRSYIKRNPDYNPFTDDTLNDSGRWIVANAMFQVEVEKPITLCNCTLDFSYGFLILTFLGGFRGSIGIAVDGNGNLGIIGSFGGGANLFSTVGLGPSLTVTNAPTLNQLNGPSTQFGGQLGQYKTLGVEYIGFNGYDGLSLSGKNSIQLPIPIEVHATATNSWVFPLNNWR